MFPELTGFLFPNDVHIHWSLMIVLYPYITGLVAGAFIVSSLYHVFGQKQLKDIAQFSLVFSLALLPAAGMVLVMVPGGGKAAVVAQALTTPADPLQLPARLAARPNAIWLLEPGSAADL